MTDNFPGGELKLPDSIYREFNKHDLIKYIFFIFLTIVVALLDGFYILPLSVPLYFIVLIFVIYILILWHSRTIAYHCKNCQHEFEITFWQDLFSAHLPTRKYIKCPKCEERTWATALVKISKRY